MDLMTVGVFALSFVACALLVAAVSLLGAKEKTYEEALEEQKQKLAKEKGGHGGKKAAGNKAKAAKEAAAASRDAQKMEKRKNARAQARKEKDDLSDEGSSELPSPVTPEPTKESLISTTLAEEPTPQSTPEPEPLVQQQNVQQNAAKPANTKKNKGAKKIAIQEVEEEVAKVEVKVTEVAPPAAPKVEEATPKASPVPNTKAKKAKGGNKDTAQPAAGAASNAKLSPREVITAVKKTKFGEEDAQNLIEILLNKTSGGNVHDLSAEWVESGPGSKNDVNTLKKDLANKTEELAEEAQRVKSITERMAVLRQELNQAKSLQVNAQRVVDDLQARHQHELNNVTGRLQVQNDQHNAALAQFQAQIQLQVGQIQTLQASLDQLTAEKQTLLMAAAAAGQQQQVDPQVYTELDGLRTAKSSLESEVGNLKAQVSQAQEAAQKEAEKAAVAAKDLAKVAGEKSGLESKVKSLEAGLTSEGGLKEELAEVRSRLGSVEKENSRLSEENERLAEQLAANVERPRAEGQEANGKSNGVENGHNGVGVEEERKQGQAWQKKYQIAVQEKESALLEKESTVAKLQSEVKTFEVRIQKVQEELDSQKAKNDDLSEVVAKTKRDTESTQQALLLRLFPEVKVTKDQVHETWIESFASEVKSSLTSKVTEVKTGGSNEEVEALEKQVANYKTVLAQTETMLNDLQSSVESEEEVWKQRLAEKEDELTKAASERESLAKKNAALQESLAVVKQAEEELDAIRGKLESEQRKNSDLGAQVAKMGQIISTSQEALQQEQKTVELLKGAKDSESISSENGPKTSEAPKTPQSASSSQLGSVASLESAEGATPDKKKSKKKKLFGMFK